VPDSPISGVGEVRLDLDMDDRALRVLREVSGDERRRSLGGEEGSGLSEIMIGLSLMPSPGLVLHSVNSRGDILGWQIIIATMT
jgi:hypothetical protein